MKKYRKRRMSRRPRRRLRRRRKMTNKYDGIILKKHTVRKPILSDGNNNGFMRVFWGTYIGGPPYNGVVPNEAVDMPALLNFYEHMQIRGVKISINWSNLKIAGGAAQSLISFNGVHMGTSPDGSTMSSAQEQFAVDYNFTPGSRPIKRYIRPYKYKKKNTQNTNTWMETTAFLLANNYVDCQTQFTLITTGIAANTVVGYIEADYYIAYKNQKPQ